jgi:ribonuclease Z
MEKLIVLGTGNAMVTRCYNTCFAIFDGEDYFLVDGGGGNGILKQTDNARIPFERVRNLFVSHAHTDHILGVIWVIRKITTMLRQGKYEPPFTIYCYPELVETIWTIAKLTLVLAMLKQIEENNVLFRSVADGDTAQIGHYGVTFFDIHSTKQKQFGFTLGLMNGRKLTFTGDEPYNEHCREYVAGSQWLLNEAFCLYAERERFKPYEKHHATGQGSLRA